MHGDNRRNGQITGERKAVYYVGMALLALGLITFFSIFVSVGLAMSQPMLPGPGLGSGPDVGSFSIRAVLGMGLCLIGTMLMNVGSRGLAGSGVVLVQSGINTSAVHRCVCPTV